ncbi:hypothetical protein AgCh_012639 [Apium graveolens]
MAEHINYVGVSDNNVPEATNTCTICDLIPPTNSVQEGITQGGNGTKFDTLLLEVGKEQVEFFMFCKGIITEIWKWMDYHCCAKYARPVCLSEQRD